MLRLVLLILFIAVACAGPRPATTAGTWQGLTVGRYQVGVSIIEARDSTRPDFRYRPDSTRGPGRPMQIVLWYPSRAGGRSLTLRDYVEWSASALGPDSSTNDRKRHAVDDFAAEPLASGISRFTVDSVLKIRMQATRDAPHVGGSFPLVMLLHTSPWGASVMSEYLASQGFVVAAFESKGARDAAYRLSRENLDAMVQDAVFTIDRMRREPYVSRQLGIIGMSNGAIAAVAIQLAGIRPQAVVSLDGGIGERAGGTYLSERTGGVPATFTVPLLHLYTPDNPHLELQHIRSYVAAPRMLIRVGHLRHGDFLTGGALEGVVPGFFGRAPTHVSLGFEFVTRYTYQFLRWQLTADDAASRFLNARPAQNGASAGLLEIERLPVGNVLPESQETDRSGER